MAIFSILILLIHGHGRSFFISDVFFNLLLQCLTVLIIQPFIYLIIITPTCFILFETIVKALSPLLLSVSLSFVRKNTSDLEVLIMHPTTLLKGFTIYRSFPGVLMYCIISSANENNLISYFTICVILLFLVI